MNELIGIILMGYAVVPPGFLPADGRCLPIREFPELSETLREGNDWVYGKCNIGGFEGFRLPDLTSKDKHQPMCYAHQTGTSCSTQIPIIRVK